MLNFKSCKKYNKHYTSLDDGNIVVIDSELYSFIRCKRGNKSIVVKKLSNNTEYSIRVVNTETTYDVIGNLIVNQNDISHFIDNCENELCNLSYGDYFVIATGSNKIPELFRYERKHGKKILAINPLTGKEFRIDPTFKFIKINSIITKVK